MTWSKTQRVLLGLLAVQLVLAAALAAWSERANRPATTPALFSFDPAAADAISIEGPDHAHAELARRDGVWVVTAAGDFPADAARVQQLLGKLATLPAGEAVATSPEAAERFRVADSSFERRIRVKSGAKDVAVLLLGSQAAQQTYARRPGENEVRGVDLASYDLPTRADDWIDRSRLRIARDEIASIELAGLVITQAAKSAAAPGAAQPPPAAAWHAEGLGRAEQLDAAAADRLAQVLAELRFDQLLGRDGATLKQLGATELHLTVRRRNGTSVDYELHKPGAGEERILRFSDRPEAFSLDAGQARALLDAATRRALVRTGAASAPAQGKGR